MKLKSQGGTRLALLSPPPLLPCPPVPSMLPFSQHAGIWVKKNESAKGGMVRKEVVTKTLYKCLNNARNFSFEKKREVECRTNWR